MVLTLDLLMGDMEEFRTRDQRLSNSEITMHEYIAITNQLLHMSHWQ